MTQLGEYYTHLAESYSIDEEKHLIIFKLKKGISFTDGSPLNADVVAWNINEWTADGRGNEDIDYAVADDEYTVSVHYINWQNVLLQTFASHSYAVCSKEFILKNGKEFASMNPIGSGPFVLKEWQPGAKIIFERNLDYWMEGMPFLDEVEYHQITDVMTQSAAVMSTGPDAVDYFVSRNAEQTYTLISNGVDFDYSYMRAGGTLCLLPNSVDEADNPFYDIRVRKALSYALDRESLTGALGYGITKPAYQVHYEGFAGNLDAGNPLLDYKHDPAKAKALLSEAGYPDGFTTTLYSNAMYRDEVTVIQTMLEEVGITVNLEFPEAGRLQDLSYNGWDGLYFMSFGGLINTGVSYFISYHPDYTAYVSAFRPPEYNDMYLAVRRSQNIDDELCDKLGSMILEYNIFTPVYHTFSTFFIRNGLKDSGFPEHTPDTIWTPWRAYWDR
jgi:ABC-type transport system substrate-binding protein